MTDTFTDTPGTLLTAHTPELGGPVTLNFGVPNALPAINPSGTLSPTVGSSNSQHDYAAPVPNAPWTLTVNWTVPPTYENSSFCVSINDPAGLAATIVTWLQISNLYVWTNQDDAGNTTTTNPATAHTAGDTWTFQITWDSTNLILSDDTGLLDTWTPPSTFTPTTVSIRAATPADVTKATTIHSIALTTP